MAYGGNPATDTTDAIRLAIGDTSASPVLTDDEIDYYYSTYGSVLLAASHAAGDLAGRYANRVSKKVGSRSIENDQLFQHYSALADKLLARYRSILAGSIIVPTTIGVIRDSVAENFPASQKLTDIDPEEFGDADA